MVHKRKYTKNLLEAAAKNSVSIAEVMRHLGIIKWTGGQHALVRERLREYGIDTSHFLGQASGSGSRHKGGPAKTPWQKVLVKRTAGLRQKACKLRRALIEAGVSYCCTSCDQGDTWKGKELRLEVEHINGDWLDDRRENLEFLCPNCHSQRITRGKKVWTEVTSDAAYYRERRARRRGGNKVDP